MAPALLALRLQLSACRAGLPSGEGTGSLRLVAMSCASAPTRLPRDGIGVLLQLICQLHGTVLANRKAVEIKLVITTHRFPKGSSCLYPATDGVAGILSGF